MDIEQDFRGDIPVAIKQTSGPLAGGYFAFRVWGPTILLADFDLAIINQKLTISLPLISNSLWGLDTTDQGKRTT
jgi:hypothetical protein